MFCEWLEASFSVSSVVWGSFWLLGFRSGFISVSWVSFSASLRVSRGLHLGIRSSFAFGVSLYISFGFQFRFTSVSLHCFVRVSLRFHSGSFLVSFGVSFTVSLRLRFGFILGRLPEGLLFAFLFNRYLESLFAKNFACICNLVVVCSCYL